MDEVRPVLERGLVWPQVTEIVPLAEVAAVHRRLDTGHGRGKTVLLIAPEIA